MTENDFNHRNKLIFFYCYLFLLLFLNNNVLRNNNNYGVYIDDYGIDQRSCFYRHTENSTKSKLNKSGINDAEDGASPESQIPTAIIKIMIYTIPMMKSSIG